MSFQFQMFVVNRGCKIKTTHTAHYSALHVNALVARCAAIGIHSNIVYHKLRTLCASTYGIRELLNEIS